MYFTMLLLYFVYMNLKFMRSMRVLPRWPFNESYLIGTLVIFGLATLNLSRIMGQSWFKCFTRLKGQFGILKQASP